VNIGLLFFDVGYDFVEIPLCQVIFLYSHMDSSLISQLIVIVQHLHVVINCNVACLCAQAVAKFGDIIPYIPWQ